MIVTSSVPIGIERVPARRAEVERLHKVVDRDPATAEELRDRSRGWALAIEFSRLAPPEREEVFERLDCLRQKRHRAIYDAAGRVSGAEVRDAHLLAAQIIPILKEATGRLLA